VLIVWISACYTAAGTPVGASSGSGRVRDRARRIALGTGHRQCEHYRVECQGKQSLAAPISPRLGRLIEHARRPFNLVLLATVAVVFVALSAGALAGGQSTREGSCREALRHHREEHARLRRPDPVRPLVDAACRFDVPSPSTTRPQTLMGSAVECE